MLIRVLKRITSKYSGFDDFYSANFCDGEHFERELSVFEVATSTVTQASVEFRTSFLGFRDEPIMSSDLDGVGDATIGTELGKTDFQFTREQHRTIDFFDDTEARSYGMTAFSAVGRQ